ncbi:MAG: LLM class flavin-dependent oxidoreductase [Streptosporangiaceae bacterium]
MVSDHVVITPDVAEWYPERFLEPFTTLSWLAGITTRVRLGTTVIVLPYRQPLLVARMAGNPQRAQRRPAGPRGGRGRGAAGSEETRRPDEAWRALTAVATHRRTAS